MATDCPQLDQYGFLKSLGVDFGATDPSHLGVTFPGGARIEAVGEEIRKAPKQVMAQLSAALAPLQPVFDIVDALLSIKTVLDAVKSLNPVTIANAIAKLAPKIDKLKQLIPQVSVVKLVADILDALIAFLVVYRAEVHALVDAKGSVDAAKTLAGTLGGSAKANLLAATSCAEGLLAMRSAVMAQKAGPVNRLIAAVNLLGGIVGLPAIPSLEVSDGTPLAATEQAAADAITALRKVRDVLPV